MPLTSGKLYCMSTWRDIKEPIDAINKEHCKDGCRKIFLYGCSLGAICATLYLIEDANNTPV